MCPYSPLLFLGEGDPVDQERDIIRLKSRETVTYRRQNKSVKEENKSENKAEEDEVAVRKSKEIGANNEKASKAINNAHSETQNLSNSPSVSELREILGGHNVPTTEKQLFWFNISRDFRVTRANPIGSKTSLGPSMDHTGSYN